MTPSDHQTSGDTPMTGIYISVLIVEVIIITLLYILGRIYT